MAQIIIETVQTTAHKDLEATIKNEFSSDIKLKKLVTGLFVLSTLDFINKNNEPGRVPHKVKHKRFKFPRVLYDCKGKCFCQQVDNISLRDVRKPVHGTVAMFRCHGTAYDRRPIQATEDVPDTTACSVTGSLQRLHLDQSSLATSLSPVSQGMPAERTHQQQRQQQVQWDVRRHEPPKHPEFADLNVRLESFSPHDGLFRWPHDDGVQDLNNLAKIGFFYTGQQDLCRCFHCGIGFKDWTSDDDALFVHLKFSPNCQYLNHHENPSNLATYRSLIQHTGGTNSSHLVSQGEANTIKHPEYRDLNIRLASFSGWSHDHRQTPQMLAEAGFFYTGFRDVVRCFTCDGGLQKWEAGDQPWIEHARWFPFCNHVREAKGDEYIRLIQSAEIVQEPSFDVDEVGQVNSVYPLTTEAATTVLVMGYSKAAVRLATDDCKVKNLPMTAENFINVLVEKEDRGETLPQDDFNTDLPPDPKFNESTKEGLMAERAYLRNRLMCHGCQTKEANILFLPCGHHKMCERCARYVQKCPICDKDVKQKLKTFMS